MIGIKPDISTATEPLNATIRILLVEDNVDNQFLFCAFVKRLSCQIEVAENGAIGVEKFKSGSYDLVLMDMQMPVMDGLTAVREIRRHELSAGLARTPVLMLTANALPEHIAAAEAAGADGHLSKPVTAATLFAAIAALERQERMGVAAARG